MSVQRGAETGFHFSLRLRPDQNLSHKGMGLKRIMVPGKRCLYCSAHGSSDEHVISEALGCKELLRGAVCRRCNSTFGHSFEAKFINGLALFLNFFQIPNGKGMVPSVEVTGKFGSEEIKFKITGDGKAEAHTTFLEGAGAGPAYAKKFRVFQKSEEGKIEDVLGRRHPNLVWTQIRECKDLQVIGAKPNFDPSLLCSLPANRTVAKYALNLLAQQLGYEWVSCHAQDLISFIKVEPSSVRAGIIWQPALHQRFPFAPPKHQFMVVCNSGSSTITVFQYLFSPFPYCVIVHAPPILADCMWVNALDPRDGKFVPLFLSGAPELLARQELPPFPMPEFGFSDSLRRAKLGASEHAIMAAKNAIQFMQGCPLLREPHTSAITAKRYFPLWRRCAGIVVNRHYLKEQIP